MLFGYLSAEVHVWQTAHAGSETIALLQSDHLHHVFTPWLCFQHQFGALATHTVPSQGCALARSSSGCTSAPPSQCSSFSSSQVSNGAWVVFSFFGGVWGYDLGMLLLFHSLVIPFLPFLSAPSRQAGVQALAGLTSTCMLMFLLPKQVSHPGLYCLLYPHTRAEVNPSALQWNAVPHKTALLMSVCRIALSRKNGIKPWLQRCWLNSCPQNVMLLLQKGVQRDFKSHHVV